MSLPSVELALWTRLVTDAGVSALVENRVYKMIAPSGVARPYIVYYLGSGLLERLTPRLDTNEVYRIEAVGNSSAAADALRQAIYSALDSAPLALAGFSNFWLKAERITTLPEVREGVQIYRYITDFRVRTSAL